jgi:hypothetical protein
MADQINKFSTVSSALTEQGKGMKQFVPPKNNALESPQHLGVYFCGDARARPGSSGEAWSEDEYTRLVRLVVQHPVTEQHRWKQISHALAINPAPDDQSLREIKEKEQEALTVKNKKKKKPEEVEIEQCYYCHGCGNKNNLPKSEDETSICDDCATPNVLRSPEECFLQLPILYLKYKDKILTMDDDVIMKQRLGALFEQYPTQLGKELSQQERAEKQLYDEHFVYGEWKLDEFNKMMQRCKRVFGHLPKDQNGVFWDLGCGTGKLVIAAGCIHPFTQCWGIDKLRTLTNCGEKMVKDFRDSEPYKGEAERWREITLRVANSDFTESDAWVDNTTFVVCHSTCFTDEMMATIVEKARSMNIGTMFVTTTKPLPDDSLWFRIGEDEIEMTWGTCKIFFHEKIAVG